MIFQVTADREAGLSETVTSDGMPAIVTQGIFDRVQERMEKNQHKPAYMRAETEYILSFFFS